VPADYRLSIENARKWLALAERRRAYFVELYRSGRWPRYYSEEAFKAHMRDVTKDVERWTKVIAQWSGEPADRSKTAA
jgi:uncharacterized repeat protein (TIGR03809 family)